MAPDLLIIDEVLAVGDLSFKLKCYERINELAKNAAVLFVSHSLGQVARMCNRGIFLEKGRVILQGDAQEAIAMYQEHLGHGNEKANRQTLNPGLVSLQLLAGEQHCLTGGKVPYGTELALVMDVSMVHANTQLRIFLRDASSGIVMDWNSARSDFLRSDTMSKIRAELGPAELNPGAYSLTLQVMSHDGREHFCVSDPVNFRIVGELLYAVPIQRRAKWSAIA
jgi:lipopolysaccharide transport system ATP-binding protein